MVNLTFNVFISYKFKINVDNVLSFIHMIKRVLTEKNKFLSKVWKRFSFCIFFTAIDLAMLNSEIYKPLGPLRHQVKYNLNNKSL